MAELARQCGLSPGAAWGQLQPSAAALQPGATHAPQAQQLLAALCVVWGRNTPDLELKLSNWCSAATTRGTDSLRWQTALLGVCLVHLYQRHGLPVAAAAGSPTLAPSRPVQAARAAAGQLSAKDTGEAACFAWWSYLCCSSGSAVLRGQVQRALQSAAADTGPSALAAAEQPTAWGGGRVPEMQEHSPYVWSKVRGARGEGRVWCRGAAGACGSRVQIAPPFSRGG